MRGGGAHSGQAEVLPRLRQGDLRLLEDAQQAVDAAAGGLRQRLHSLDDLLGVEQVIDAVAFGASIELLEQLLGGLLRQHAQADVG